MTWFRTGYTAFWTVVVLMLSGCSVMSDFVANDIVFKDPGVRPATYRVIEEGNVGFAAQDGTWLAADIYHPKGLSRSPAILVRIPFTDTLENRLRSRLIAHYWASRGYSVVVQGTRGRYRSGGRYYPLVSERDDGIDTLKWIAKQDWFDGRLAMWGGSAFGYTQWAISDQQNPGAQAFFIQIASSDFYRMFYSGNAFNLESALYWAIRSRGDQDREVTPEDLDRGLWHVPLLKADDVAIGDTDFFNDWLLHPNRDAYWTQIDGVNRAQSIQAPVLFLGGWFDPFLPTQLTDFQAVQGRQDNPRVADESRLIIGPWGHANSAKLPPDNLEVPYRKASVLPSIPWFDAQLNPGEEAQPQPKVLIFVMGENRWREEDEWPLARTVYTPYYLDSTKGANSLAGDGTLLPGQMTTGRESDVFTYDPEHPVPTSGGAMLGDRSGMQLQHAIESRHDVLVYSTPVLDKNVEVTGPVKAILYVTTSAPSTDFTAKLVDVHPDGSAYNVSDGILRRRYAQQPGGMQSPQKIEIDLWPTSNVFFMGHRIRLEVSSSNFPHYDRNPNTGESLATTTEMRRANQRVFHSSLYPSQIILPIVPEMSP